MTTGTSKQRLLWGAAIGLWAFGCVVLVVGGGIWWNYRQPAEEVWPVLSATSTEVVVTLGTVPDTPTPASSINASTPPTSTPVIIAPLPVQESAGDSLALVAPTSIPTPTPPPAPEGIIVFFSSRDHPQTAEEIRDHSGAHDLELYAMRPDGSRQTRLSDGTVRWTNYPTPYLRPYFINGQIVISGRLVFDLKIRQIVDELVTSQMVNGLPLRFKLISSDESPFIGVDPVWSPAGEIIFSGGAIRDNSSLYYLETIDSPVQKLTIPPDDAWGDGFPDWSPDGNWIVFDRQWNDYSQDGLWIITKDGGQMQRLVEPLDLYNGTRQSAWSPDGQTIAYEGYKENNDNQYHFELWAVDVAGQNPRQLTYLPENFSIWGPVWSPDSRQIAFTMTGGGTNIYTIDIDGGEPRQMTFEGYTNPSPLWLPLDADEILAGGDTPLQAPPTPTPRPEPQQSQPAKAANCPSPGVQISSPAAGSRFTQRNNFIVGTANIPRFHHWRLEYSTDPNGGWSYLLERDYPVDNDKLAMIDASTIPNGPYGLRLTVVDETGNYPEPCEVWFTNGY